MVVKQQADLKTVQRYAWLNVCAGFSLIFFMLTVPAVLMPIMYGSIMDDMGWSRGQVTAFASWKFLSGAITALVLGFVVDRFGIKIVVVIGATLVAISLGGMHLVNALWVFYFFGFTLGITAIIASVGCKILLSRWFAFKLGRVVGIAFVGGSIAGVVTPLIGRYLIDMIGWQSTATILGIVVWILVVPLFLFLVRERPEDFGYSADMVDGGHKEKQASTGLVLSEIIRSKPFWLIVIAHFFVGAIDHSMLEHTALFIEKDAGMGKIAAAGGVSVAMLASIAGKLGFGWLYDRFSMRGIALCWWTLALSIALAFPVMGMMTMTVFVIVRGASHGGVLIDIPCLARHNFGTRSIAKIVSFFSAANMLGGAASTATVGYAHDYFGSYTIPFIVLIFMAITAGLIVISLSPKYWQPPKAVSNTKVQIAVT